MEQLPKSISRIEHRTKIKNIKDSIPNIYEGSRESIALGLFSIITIFKGAMISSRQAEPGASSETKIWGGGGAGQTYVQKHK